MQVYIYKVVLQRIRPTDRFLRILLRKDPRGWIIVKRELMPK